MNKKDIWNQLPREARLKAAGKMGELAGKGVGLAIDVTLKIKGLDKNKDNEKSKR
ncbi:hypothetical protein [Bacillus sp. B1-b2]|uniref:hypothetical protein n=1 Tax=Bacillus sp. B1-b2 TaxID=2653201 RepID=UPI00186A6D21|nr:hypothetical protein [Bacillus sp. B1-b2]